MQPIRSVRDVADRYDAVLCDVWGVLHDGRTVYPGAGEALRGLRAAGLGVVLLTNMPRPSSTMPGALARLGFPEDAWDAIVTSGDAIRVELAARAPGPVHVLGRTTDRGLWNGLGLDFVDDVADASFLGIAGLRGDAEVPGDYDAELRVARERDLELLCANPDLVIRSGGHLRWCAGSVAQAYEAMGGQVVQAGKPHAAIYGRALEIVDAAVGHPVPRARILAIGDGIGTDILGANRQGLDSVFVASGMHGDAFLRGSGVDERRVAEVLAAESVSATYVIPRLA